MPMERAVPAMMRAACSGSEALRSAAFIFTISMICAFVTLPTFSEFGLPEAYSIPAAFLRRTAAGGDLRMNEKLRSA